MRERIFMNHIGFPPGGAKHCVVKYPQSAVFTVINRRDGRVVYEGRLQPVYGGDLDEAWVGDFTPVTAEGTYVVRCGAEESRIIVIHKKPYEIALRTLCNYFPAQRCGDSRTGWNAPCHLKDAEDIATGEHRDVTGGWHQSCDTRKWVFGTATGLLALCEAAAFPPLARYNGESLDEEIRWGNRYFHAMIRGDGGLMDFVCIPNDWDHGGPRKLVSDDSSPLAFFNLIAGQCRAADHFRDRDPAYAARCAAAARTLWGYVNSDGMKDHYSPRAFKYHEYLPTIFRKSYKGSACYEGDRLYAAMTLYRATGEQAILEDAAATADRYCRLQVAGDPEADLSAGAFWLDETREDLSGAYAVGNLGPLGLGLLVRAAPGHGNSPVWRASLVRAARQMVLSSRRNPWGLIPSYWHARDVGGCRPGGSHFYKYFYEDKTLHIGANYDILHRALFLLCCADLTGFPADCRAAAARQVDWVLGCNPFDASTCEGVGYNQRQMLINSDEFMPPTPQIPGAVQTGIGCIGSTDCPDLLVDGVTREYDMPCVSLLLWVIKEMLAGE